MEGFFGVQSFQVRHVSFQGLGQAPAIHIVMEVRVEKPDGFHGIFRAHGFLPDARVAGGKETEQKRKGREGDPVSDWLHETINLCVEEDDVVLVTDEFRISRKILFQGLSDTSVDHDFLTFASFLFLDPKSWFDV